MQGKLVINGEIMLNKIKNISNIKKLSIEDKNKLSADIRKYLLKVVSNNGGHLASNLGVVELTIALFSVYDFPKDKIIWDVGHQTYVYKLLSGRDLSTLRKFNGIAGFPKSSESEYDSFNTGHSSTSISASLGIARARDINKEKYNVISVIGDGALTGGMALEALNDAGSSKINMTVILNDNEMSISKNHGGLNMFLSRLRSKRLYTKSNSLLKKSMLKVPVVGKSVVRFCQKTKRTIKQLIIPKMFFEDIGFTYLGPVDGHNIEGLEKLLSISKKIDGPVLVHVLTKKGKGYKYAEENPEKYHSVSPFNIRTGKSKAKKKDDYSKIFGNTLCNLASKNHKIVAITASMEDGTGLNKFEKKYPDRFFDVGIAEQHALCLAAGLAKGGVIPVIPIYSSFYQRGYDQVIHDIAMQNLHVVMCVDRAGIVGSDGETHQGTFDMAFFRLIPNLIIMAPKDYVELKSMLKYAINIKKPVVIRYPRGSEIVKFDKCSKIIEGKSEIITEGNDITIIAIGNKVSTAYSISKKLEKCGISVEVINTRFLKPLDEKQLINSINKTKKVITIEDGTIINGLASSIKEIIINNELKDITIKSFAYPDKFIEHGSINELENEYGMNEESIIQTIKEML